MAKKGLFQRLKDFLLGPSEPPKPIKKTAPAPRPASQTQSRQSYQRRIDEVEARVREYAAHPRSQRVGAGRPEDEQSLFWRIYDEVMGE